MPDVDGYELLRRCGRSGMPGEGGCPRSPSPPLPAPRTAHGPCEPASWSVSRSPSSPLRLICHGGKRRWARPASYRLSSAAVPHRRVSARAGARSAADRTRGSAAGAGPPLDLHQGVLPRAGLGELRRAAVEGEHVRIAVDAHRVGVGRVERVVPGARRELDHAGTHGVASRRRPARQLPRSLYTRTTSPSRTPRVRGVGGMDADRLAPLHLRGLAERADVELAVRGAPSGCSPRGGAGSARRAARRATRWARARTDDRDSRRSRSGRWSPRRSRCGRSASPSGAPSGSARNCFEDDQVVDRASGTSSEAGRPELVEAGERRPPSAGDLGAPALVEVPQPRHLVPALGEAARRRRAPRRGRRRSRYSLRASRHGATAWRIAIRQGSFGEPPMSFRSSVIVAGSTTSAWRAIGVQNGSWTTIVSGPWRARGAAGQVLVVVERIAAAPVDEADVG